MYDIFFLLSPFSPGCSEMCLVSYKRTSVLLLERSFNLLFFVDSSWSSVTNSLITCVLDPLGLHFSSSFGSDCCPFVMLYPKALPNHFRHWNHPFPLSCQFCYISLKSLVKFLSSFLVLFSLWLHLQARGANRCLSFFVMLVLSFGWSSCVIVFCST